MSDALPIQLIEPSPITTDEIDTALAGGSAANDGTAAKPRGDMLFSPQQLDTLLDAHAKQVRAELVNTPETRDFMAGVALEAAHQRERWGSEHDAGKTPFDWVLLIGHLATRAALHFMAGNMDKALHHAITTAAACANWHLAMQGKTNMAVATGKFRESGNG